MAEVWIPGLLRGLCRGSDTVQAAGLTLGEVIDALEAVCPGIRARLVKDRDIADGLAVVVDGEVKCVGKVPKKDEIKAWIQKYPGKTRKGYT